MRLVAWNIRAGGGRRCNDIVCQLVRWGADIAGLSEFRGSVPSVQLAGALHAAGLEHQLTTIDPLQPNRNSLMLASRWPLRPVRLRRAPLEPGRWLLAEVGAEQPFSLGLMHAPNMVTGRKLPYLRAVENVAHSWQRGPALFMGDTNCGWPGLDEERPVFNRETERWLNSLAALGWRDAFRVVCPDERCYTWYSPNGGNGFRLDQAFVNRKLLPRLSSARYEWGSLADGASLRRDELSDHAALLVDLEWATLVQP
jgi:exonuclease III